VLGKERSGAAGGAVARALEESQLTSSYFAEDGSFDPIAVTAGIIQTAVYADFGYIVSTAQLLRVCGTCPAAVMGGRSSARRWRDSESCTFNGGWLQAVMLRAGQTDA
jgi:hypothetical protein